MVPLAFIHNVPLAFIHKSCWQFLGSTHILLELKSKNDFCNHRQDSTDGKVVFQIQGVEVYWGYKILNLIVSNFAHEIFAQVIQKRLFFMTYKLRDSLLACIF